MPRSRSTAGVTRYKLDNGLTVILQENNTVPVVAFNVWVRAGSAEETEAESGIAHVHEHMLFKGTKRRGVGEIAKEVESSGGHLNAYTSFDQTVYYNVIASRYFDTGLDVLADSIQNSTFDAVELAKEKDVILEEIKRGEDMPGSKLSKALFETAYQVHPYRRPIIGTEAHVLSFTRKMILDFYKRWYVPNNMVLVIVGDFKSAAVRPKIADAFRDAVPNLSLDRARKREPAQKKSRLAVVPEDVQQGYMMLGFPTCAIRHADIPVLDIIAIILGQGESSRLYRRVKADQQRVFEVRAHSYPLRDPGLFLISTLIDPAIALEAQEAVLREVFRLRVGFVSGAELEKAKINLEADAIYDRETVQGQALKLGYYETLAGDIAYEGAYMRGVAAVTHEDVRRVASRYFDPRKLNLAYLLPPKAAESLRAGSVQASIDDAEQSVRGIKPGRPPKGRRRSSDAAAIAELAERHVTSENLPVHREKLRNGLTIIVKESHAVPVIAIRAVMLGGLTFENRITNGINDFIGSMLTKGTRRRSAIQIAEEIERMAGSIEGHSGRNSLGLEVEVLSKYLDRAIDILADVLLEPAFRKDEIEKQRADTLAAIQRREDNVAGLAIDTFTATLYQKHPYRLTLLGTPRSVRSFNKERLRDYYRKLAVPENLVIAVVGDVRGADVIKRISRAFGKMRARPFNYPRRPREKPPASPRYREVYKDKAQAHLVYGFLGTTVTDPEKYALDVMSTVLAGQGGRLFLELRDRQSLAYSVTSFALEGIDPGYVGVYMGTSPEKVPRAITGIRKELRRIRRDLVSSDELERAKRNLVGGYEIDLQRVSAQATQLAFNERFGLGEEEYAAYPEKILSVTAQDVQRVARKYLALDRSVIALARPPLGRKSKTKSK